MQELLSEELKTIEEQLYAISDDLYHHPELGDDEFRSMKMLVHFLEKNGFEIETNIINRPTAFKATFTSKKPGPTIAFLAEYDALPGIGHGCGHNLIGTMSSGAGVILSKILNDIGGSVVVLGTPAEETNGAKVPMSEQGIFDTIDIAMILHGADQSYGSGSTAAMQALQFEYIGKSSHAAASPEEGINALDGVIQLFNGTNALREHVPSDVRIHGIISEGGLAPNVVPDRSVAKFYIRAKNSTDVQSVANKMKHIAEGASLITGTSVHISNFEPSFDNMNTNETMNKIFTNHLEAISNQTVLPGEHSFGSVDMGNVSKVVPAIHPFIGLNKPGLDFHTKEFADQTISPDGHAAIKHGALALANTGYDIIKNKNLFQSIKDEFEKNRQ